MPLAQGDGLAGPEEVMTARFDRENAQAALAWLFQLGDVVEVRIPKAKRLKPVSGYFNRREKLIDALRSASGEYAAVHYTLNPVTPAGVDSPSDLTCRFMNRAGCCNRIFVWFALSRS
jgi:hypothetical protein